MTSNQLKAAEIRELQRSNKAKERETERSNRQKEKYEKRRQDIGAAVDTAKLIGSINDPSWYNLDKQLVKDVAQISTNAPLGNAFNTIDGKAVLPGIMAINFIPTIGNSGNNLNNSVIEIATKNIYAFVRHANSGSRNYDSPDLMQYLMAMDSVYSFYASMTRIYSAVMSSKAMNRYYIDGLLYALGVDPNDIRNNIANFRAYINSFAVRANSFYVPNTMPMYSRHYWLNTNIFKDSPVKKSQEYVFVQQRFGIYDELNARVQFAHKVPVLDDTVSTAQAVCPAFSPNANITFKQIQALGNLMLSVLTASEDIGIMSGDILKAYDSSKLLFLHSIEEDFHIESIYSEEVLSQITNLTVCGEPMIPDSIKEGNKNSTWTGFDIRQNPDGTIYQGLPLVKGPNALSDLGNDPLFGLMVPIQAIAGYTGSADPLFDWHGYDMSNMLINMYKDDVSPDEFMVATRLMVNAIPNVAYKGASGAEGKYGYFVAGVGTELVTFCKIVTYNDDFGQPSDVLGYFTYAGIVTLSPSPLQGDNVAAMRIRELLKFDWAPIIYFNTYEETSNGNIGTIYHMFNNMDAANYCSVSREVLNNLHYVAVLSEFGVPLLGYSVRTR